MLIFVFGLLHLLVIFLILNEQKKKKLVLNPFLLFVLVLFPIVGAASVYLYNSQRSQAGHQPAPSFERVIPWMSDESLTEDEDTRDVSSMDAKEIIPFQEALLLNNAGVKRSLIIDLIFERPDQFVPLLYQARLNDDVEVVHYATTILSELTSKYDAKLQTLEGRMLDEPDSLAAKEAYLQFLQLYIDSQLAEGYYAKRLRQRYAELVRSLQHQGLLLELSYFVKLGGNLSGAGRPGGLFRPAGADAGAFPAGGRDLDAAAEGHRGPKVPVGPATFSGRAQGQADLSVSEK